MRRALCFFVMVVWTLQYPHTAIAYHDMTCHPPPPPSGGGYEFGFDLFSSSGGASSALNLILRYASGANSDSCSDADGHVDPFGLPPDSVSAVELIPETGEASRYWLFEPTSDEFRRTHAGMSSELPNFTKPDGTPLLTQYNETNLDFLLRTGRTFTPGETFAVSSGEIDGWPGARLLTMPASFTLDELLAADPSQFLPYTGPAKIADIATLEVLELVPEPASATLSLLAVCTLMFRWLRIR